jgi:hypothetical protein
MEDSSKNSLYMGLLGEPVPTSTENPKGRDNTGLMSQRQVFE